MNDDDFTAENYLAFYPDDLAFECPADRLGHLVKKTVCMNVSALVVSRWNEMRRSALSGTERKLLEPRE